MLATSGTMLLLIPVLFISYLFLQSGFISYLKGTGALVSAQQFPDIHEKVKYCADKIDLDQIPDVYILHGNGLFNAFATRFLRRNYLILLSDVLDAMDDDPDVINFYIGHEMGHIDRRHLIYAPFIAPGLCLPLLGAGYSRAREYTCDMYGAMCCSDPNSASKGLSLLAVGGKRYKTLDTRSYLKQTKQTSGFWMSFHELIAGYPWLVKRFMRINPSFKDEMMPRRSVFAYMFALFIPNLTLSSLIFIYVFFVLLFVGGVMKGQELIRHAEEKRALTQQQGVYQEQYPAQDYQNDLPQPE